MTSVDGEPEVVYFNGQKIGVVHHMTSADTTKMDLDRSDADKVAEFYERKEKGLPPKGVTIRNRGPHLGRNNPCPCMSGNKYKRCCGKR